MPLLLLKFLFPAFYKISYKIIISNLLCVPALSFLIFIKVLYIIIPNIFSMSNTLVEKKKVLKKHWNLQICKSLLHGYSSGYFSVHPISANNQLKAVENLSLNLTWKPRIIEIEKIDKKSPSLFLHSMFHVFLLYQYMWTYVLYILYLAYFSYTFHT